VKLHEHNGAPDELLEQARRPEPPAARVEWIRAARGFGYVLALTFVSMTTDPA
jgi:hypothetical protein